MSDFSDVKTVSAYEVGSVHFLTNLQRMEAWVEPGVPVSGDATACLRHRASDDAEPSLTDRVDAIASQLGTISKGPWQAARGAIADGTQFVTTKEQKAEFLALSLNNDESPLWLVVAPDVIPAATGDGPNAKANAEFLASAPETVEYLLTRVRKQAAALESVGKVAARLEARAALNTRVSATGIYDDAMQLAADAASSIALVTAGALRAALGDEA